MLQLVVYPGWLHFTDHQLINWYHTGKGNIWYLGLFLAPGQLFFSGIQVTLLPSWYSIGTFSIIIFLWIYSFTVISSIHNKIMGGEDTSAEHRRRLIKTKLVRVAGSTMVFLWSFCYLSTKFYFF